MSLKTLFTAFISFSVFAVIFLFIRLLLSTRRPTGFPPGPPTILGLGNLHQVPLAKPFLKFHEWSKTYGDIIGLKMGPKNFIVLCNPEHMRELFAIRGVKYSGRPYHPVAMEYVINPPDEHIMFMPYNDYVKQGRAAVRHTFSTEAAEGVGPLMSAVGTRLLCRLLEAPTSWHKSNEVWGIEAPVLAVTGMDLSEFGPGFVERHHQFQHEWTDILEPSNTPAIDIFPFLAYVPSFLARWKRQAAKLRKDMYKSYSMLLHAAKEKAIQRQDKYDSFYSYLLRMRDVEEKVRFTDNELAFLGGAIIDAAIDTTWSSLETLIVCLVGHPDVIKRAQQEVDQVCKEECPQINHLKHLPYLTACMMESFRWRGAANVGLPHISTEDDVFQGYTIPKGTIIIASPYSIHLREEDFSDPELFLPERYMLNDYGVSRPVAESEGRKNTYAFGLGRRVCPGADFAKNNIAMTTAKLLWAFDFEHEGPVDLSWETGFGNGLTNPPQNFHPVLRPRSAERGRQISLAGEKANQYLKEMLG